MNELMHFIKLSRDAGERFDFVQGKGGNSSVKIDDRTMLVKSSGVCLSEIGLKTGYSEVNYQKVIELLEKGSSAHCLSWTREEREIYASKALKETLVDPSGSRPSIETFLHAFFYKYTLHLHPLALLTILCQRDWKKTIQSLYSGPLMIDYFTPGLDLGLELRKQVLEYRSQFNQDPKIVFLKNHGLVVSADEPMETFELVQKIVSKAEKYTNQDFAPYQLTAEVTGFIRNISNDHLKAFLSEDLHLMNFLQTRRDLFFSKALCPDDFVFCGARPVEINFLNESEFTAYRKSYLHFPKVIVYKGHIFMVSENGKKARETEEALKAHLFVVNKAGDNCDYMSDEELAFLATWEAEKFRANL